MLMEWRTKKFPKNLLASFTRLCFSKIKSKQIIRKFLLSPHPLASRKLIKTKPQFQSKIMKRKSGKLKRRNRTM
jgi:hypothetical protein